MVVMVRVFLHPPHLNRFPRHMALVGDSGIRDSFLIHSFMQYLERNVDNVAISTQNILKKNLRAVIMRFHIFGTIVIINGTSTQSMLSFSRFVLRQIRVHQMSSCSQQFINQAKEGTHRGPLPK